MRAKAKGGSLRFAAESLRIALIASQCALLAWMIWSGLWRKLPLWCAWLASEVVSRAIFAPAGGYWHHIWLPMQPTILFLLAAAAVEARWQSESLSTGVAAAALCIAPAAVVLDLRETATLRLLLHAGVSMALIDSGGSTTARWHARIMATMAACTAALGWLPATGSAWWRMRVLYLSVAIGCTVAWGVLFTRREDPSVPSPAALR